MALVAFFALPVFVFGATPFDSANTKANEFTSWLKIFGGILMTISIMFGALMMIFGNKNKEMWLLIAAGGLIFGSAASIGAWFAS